MENLPMSQVVEAETRGDEAQVKDVGGPRADYGPTAASAAECYNLRAAGEQAKPPQRLEYDKTTQEKEDEIRRQRMSSSSWEPETDFKKYFDLRSGQGPRDTAETDFDRGRRHWNELRAWSKRNEQNDPLIYNRKVRNRARGGM
jgi:hypothetical protein